MGKKMSQIICFSGICWEGLRKRTNPPRRSVGESPRLESIAFGVQVQNITFRPISSVIYYRKREICCRKLTLHELLYGITFPLMGLRKLILQCFLNYSTSQNTQKYFRVAFSKQFSWKLGQLILQCFLNLSTPQTSQNISVFPFRNTSLDYLHQLQNILIKIIFYKSIMSFQYVTAVNNEVCSLKSCGALKCSSVSTISVIISANSKIKHVIGSYKLTSNLDRL